MLSRYENSIYDMINAYKNIDKKVIEFIRAMREKATGKYRISITNQSDLYACTYIPQILSLLNLLDRLSDEEKRLLADHIQSYQKESGYFEEFISTEWTPTKLEINRLLMTSLSASSLAILGHSPLKKMAFLDEVMTPKGMLAWYNERRRSALMAGDSWNESIATECLALCLIIHAYYKGIDIQKWDVFQIYFDCLESLQDRHTGFWGTRIGLKRKARQHLQRFTKGVSPIYPIIGMGTTFHMVDIYAAVGRPLRYAIKIAKNTIACQQADGLFNPDGGGSQCHDLDAISILSNLYDQVPLSIQNQIQLVMQKTIEAFLNYNLQNMDGGFRNRAGGEPYQKGDAPLFIKQGESDLLSTWFRLAAIAFIDQTFAKQTGSSLMKQWWFPELGFLHYFKVV